MWRGLVSSKGNHTWDIVIEYHRCPECGFINESRDKYHYQLGEYLKDVACVRCGFRFTVKKERQPKFGPLLGHE